MKLIVFLFFVFVSWPTFSEDRLDLSMIPINHVDAIAVFQSADFIMARVGRQMPSLRVIERFHPNPLVLSQVAYNLEVYGQGIDPRYGAERILIQESILPALRIIRWMEDTTKTEARELNWPFLPSDEMCSEAMAHEVLSDAYELVRSIGVSSTLSKMCFVPIQTYEAVLPISDELSLVSGTGFSCGDDNTKCCDENEDALKDDSCGTGTGKCTLINRNGLKKCNAASEDCP